MKLLINKSNNRVEGYVVVGGLEFDEDTHYIVEVDDSLEEQVNLLGSVYIDGELKLDEEILNEEQHKIEIYEMKQEQQQILNNLQQQAFMTTLDDTVAYSVRLLFAEWQVDTTYNVGDRFMYEDKFYKVEQAHKSQANWLPTNAPSLYTEISDPNVEYPEWKQPTSSTTAYNIGDKVTYEGVKYISLIDGNTWSPTDYPQGWQAVE